MSSTPQAALSIAQRVHRTAVSSRDDSQASQALLIAGWAQVKLSSYEDALASFERALTQSGAVGDDDGRLHALTGIGVVYHRVSQFDIALDCFDEVLSEARNSGFRGHETGALHHIGEVCEAMQRDEEALEFYLRAREVAGQDNAVDTLTALDVAIGDVYRKLHRSEPALEHLNRALKAATAQSDGIARAECLTSLGRLYQDLGDLPAAERYHRESIALYEAAGNRFGLIEAQHHLGWLLQQAGKDGQALEVYRAAIENGEKIDAGAHAHKSYLRASQLFEKSGQERLALDYYRRSVELRSQLSNDMLRQRVGGIMAGFDRERHEADPERVRVRVGELRQKTEALAEANRRLTVIGNIGRDITGALDLGTLMLAVHAAINSLLPGDTLGLGVYDEASRQVEYRFFIEAGQALDPITVDIDDPGSIGAWCVLQRKEAVIGDMDKDYERYVLERPASVGSRSKSAVYFPLIVRDRTIGVLTVQSRRAHAYREREIETLRVLSAYIAVALENSLVHERLVQLNGELTREKAELERANQLIRHMANHDNLTGLPNRRLLYDVIEKYVPLARRQKSTFVILYIDLDGFKPVNDHYGHAAGDTVLRTVATRLEASVRSSDVVARIGGDEFVLVFRDVSDLDAVNAMIDKLICRIEEPISLEGESISIRPSGGAAVFPRDGDDFEQLLLLADEAMYGVKAAKDRRRWAFYRQ